MGNVSPKPVDLPPEQTGAAAWYGPDIAKRDDWLMPSATRS